MSVAKFYQSKIAMIAVIMFYFGMVGGCVAVNVFDVSPANPVLIPFVACTLIGGLAGVCAVFWYGLRNILQ